MEGESSTSQSGSGSQSSTGTSQTSAPASGNSAPTMDKAQSTGSGQATSQTNQSGSSQAVTPELDNEMQTWMGSKGITIESWTKEPTKYLRMMRESESYHSKKIDELKSQYENEKRLASAKAVAPETQPEPEKRPSEMITSKYETAIGNLLYTLGVEDVNQLSSAYPQDQYPNIYQRIFDINREYQAEYQKALAQDVEFLVGGHKQKEEKQSAEEQFQKEWQEIKTKVNSNFDILRKENPQFDNHIKQSGVGNIVSKMAKLIGVPEEYVWHDTELSNFMREAMAGIMVKRDLPNIEKTWKEQNLKTLIDQKQTEIPSATNGFNYEKANTMSGLKGVSLLR